jgi:GT2 family glycosyltransferase
LSPTSLLVSIVSFRSNTTQLVLTLTSLAKTLTDAHESGLLDRAHVVIVDNDSAPPSDPHLLPDIFFELPWCETTTLSGHGNIGYGAANNLAFEKFARTGDYEFFLVLNPDVIQEVGCITSALTHFDSNTSTALISPVATNTLGKPISLLKRYPSVLVLALRGFAPSFLRKLFEQRLARYETRGTGDPAFYESCAAATIASGCFMFMRSSTFIRSGKFDAGFFLYFEDFDLSLRLSKLGVISRVTECRITHDGGNAAGKGPAHILMFVRSAYRFFHKHGWRWL